MLNVLREGAKSGFAKFILFGLMVMAVGGMVFMDVGGFFRGGVRKTTVAKIGGQELSIIAFDHTVRRALGSQGLDPQTAYQLGFIQQILRNEIAGNLTQAAALDRGLLVGDEAVLKQVDRLIAPLVTGAMDKKAALETVLRSQGMSDSDFIRMVKAEMTNTLLREVFQTGAAIPSTAEARELYRYENEERTVKTVFFPDSAIKDIAEPADDVLLPLYQAGQERYAIPEMRRFSIGILSRDKFEKTLDISDEELQSAYERDIAVYTKPERRRLSQAIAESREKADAVAESARAGKSLKDAALDAMGDEKAWLGEESFEKAGLPKEIGDAAFSAAPGDVIGPLQTALGWHVLKLEGIVAPETEPFEQVKEGLRKELLAVHVADEMFAAGGQMDDLAAGGAAFADIAAEMGLEIRQIGPVRQDGSTVEDKDGVKELGQDSAYILETAFSLGQGEVSPAFELADGRYAILYVDSLQEKTWKPFEEVKKEIAQTWIQDRKNEANRVLAGESLEALREGSKTLAQVAAAQGAEIRTQKMKRADEAPKPLDDRSKTLFFELAEGAYGVAAVQDGFVLGQVQSIALPDTASLSDEDLKPVRDRALRNWQEELIALYYGKLQADYKVMVNARLLEETYGPGSER